MTWLAVFSRACPLRPERWYIPASEGVRARLEPGPPAGVPPMSAREGLAVRADGPQNRAKESPARPGGAFGHFATPSMCSTSCQPLRRPHPDYRAPRQCKGEGR
jgi:hypothetical protein